MATTSKSMCSEQDNSDNTIMQLCMLIKKDNSIRFNSERKITPFCLWNFLTRKFSSYVLQASWDSFRK